MSVSPDRRLTEGEQLVLAAMQSADDAIVTMALDGTITHWNRAAEHLFGYSAREAIGTNIGIIVPGDRKGEMLGELPRIARGERVHHYETVRVAQGRSIDRCFPECFSGPLAVGSHRGRVQDCSRHHGKEKRGEDSFVGKLQWTLLFRRILPAAAIRISTNWNALLVD
jgi:PAS domain S-box-containing protein